jgi:hypothetical protein
MIYTDIPQAYLEQYNNLRPDQVSAAMLFKFLNGFEYSKKKDANGGKQDAKSGLSMGSLSGYHSLYNSLHEATIDLLIELDMNLGTGDVPDDIRLKSWKKHFLHASYPDIWPATPLFPKAHLYGCGQFNKEAQTAGVQRLIVVRMVYLWIKGIRLVGKGCQASNLMKASTFTLRTSTNYRHFQTFGTLARQWIGSAKKEESMRQQQKVDEAAQLRAMDDDGADPPDASVATASKELVGVPAVADDDDELTVKEYLGLAFRKAHTYLYRVTWDALLLYPWTPAETPPGHLITLMHAVEKYQIDSERARNEAAAAAARLEVKDGEDPEADPPDDLTQLLSQPGQLAVVDLTSPKTTIIEDAKTVWNQTQERLLHEAGKVLKSTNTMFFGTWQERYKADRMQGKHAASVAFLHVDPWYDMASAPDDDELALLCEASLYYSSEHAVLVIWHPWQLAGRFVAPFLASKRWMLDTYVKKVIRAPNKLGRGGQPNKLKGVTDQFMILYKLPEGKYNASDWMLYYLMKVDQVVAWYGDPKQSFSQNKRDAPNEGYPWDTDIILGYEPPIFASRLRDSNGKPLRAGAEKSVKFMQILLLMYTQSDLPVADQPKVWDPYAGTMALGLACLTLGRTYLACEANMEVFRHAEKRMAMYILKRLEYSGDKTMNPLQLNGPDADVDIALIVSLLAERGLDNMKVHDCPPGLEPDVPRAGVLAYYDGAFEIKHVPKSEMTGKQGRQMGTGLYTTKAVKAGVPFKVPLHAFGTLVPANARSMKVAGGHAIKLLSTCFDGMVLVPAGNSIARFINDYRGTKHPVNVVMVEANVDTLGGDEGHRLINIIPTRNLTANSQLLLNHGCTYLEKGHTDDRATRVFGDDPETAKERRKWRKARAKATGCVDESETEDEPPESDADATDSDESDDDNQDDDESAAEEFPDDEDVEAADNTPVSQPSLELSKVQGNTTQNGI